MKKPTRSFPAAGKIFNPKDEMACDTDKQTVAPEIKREKLTRLSYHFHFSNGSDMHFNVEE